MFSRSMKKILKEFGGLSGLALNKSLTSALHRIDNHITYVGLGNGVRPDL